jgi:tRNA 2-thiocytidine biosynthesis protein TtcA
MPPKLVSDDGHVVIRPLAFVAEKDTRVGQGAPVPHHPCNLCGSQENLQRKQEAKCCASGRKIPRPRGKHVQRPAKRGAQPFAGRRAVRFVNARATGVASEDGDKAFDEEEFLCRPRCPACRWFA